MKQIEITTRTLLRDFRHIKESLKQKQGTSYIIKNDDGSVIKITRELPFGAKTGGTLLKALNKLHKEVGPIKIKRKNIFGDFEKEILLKAVELLSLKEKKSIRSPQFADMIIAATALNYKLPLLPITLRTLIL